jgi:hypothetical protein
VKRNSVLILFAFVILLVMAEVPMKMVSRVQQSSGNSDSISADSIVKPAITAVMDTIKALTDTTKMDSIQLAIFRHNKAVDDSLAKDSINKQFFNADEWKLHPWQSCKMPTGIRSEVWINYQIIKVAYDTKGNQRRIGIITHKLIG